MSYTKNTWKAGDTITSAKLNNMEDGIAAAGGGGALIVEATVNDGSMILNKTWKEIHDATNCAFIFPMSATSFSVFTNYNCTPGSGKVFYSVTVFVFIKDGGVVDTGETTFTAVTENDYPSVLWDS